jgi:hypothetical protein
MNTVATDDQPQIRVLLGSYYTDNQLFVERKKPADYSVTFGAGGIAGSTAAACAFGISCPSSASGSK